MQFNRPCCGSCAFWSRHGLNEPSGENQQRDGQTWGTCEPFCSRYIRVIGKLETSESHFCTVHTPVDSEAGAMVLAAARARSKPPTTIQ